MLRGFRTALKYFTIGLLAGLLLAPRKGDATRALLIDRGREYVKELMNSGQQVAADLSSRAVDTARDTFRSDGHGYDSTSASSV